MPEFKQKKVQEPESWDLDDQSFLELIPETTIIISSDESEKAKSDFDSDFNQKSPITISCKIFLKRMFHLIIFKLLIVTLVLSDLKPKFAN